MTSIEQFPNEIFYEIFEYLDVYDIYQTFLNLNIRFQNFIKCSPTLHRILLKGNNSIKNQYICKTILIPNKQLILSLRLEGSNIITGVSKQCTIDSFFQCLQSLTLFDIRPIELLTILYHVKSLPRLYSLNIQLTNDAKKYISHIYQSIFRLHALQYNRLSVLTKSEQNILMPWCDTEQFSRIEYLVLAHTCTFNELLSIVNYTPRLKRLSCQNLIESNDDIDKDISLTLCDLRHVKLGNCEINFDRFEKLMKKICSNLQVLHIGNFINNHFIYPQRWKYLIFESMWNLISFKLKHKFYPEDIHFDYFDNQFIAQLWMERQWIFRLETNPHKISYLISSAKAIHGDRFSSPIQLSISNFFVHTWNTSIVKSLHSIISPIEFTSLHLIGIPMSSNTLIKLLNLLPNLDILKVFSPLFIHTNDLSLQDAEQIRMYNKITKIYQLMEFIHTEFFLFLCTHLQHLEINRVQDKDLERLIQLILTVRMTQNLDLNSIRLHIYNANDTMIMKLKYLIDSKKLLFNYTITHQKNLIDLQW